MFEAACGTVECALRPRKPDELGHDLIEIAAAEPVVTHGGTNTGTIFEGPTFVSVSTMSQ